MSLALSLPELAERPSHPPETRPVRVQVWLDDVLRKSNIEAARTIGDALAATNRVQISDSRRLELAEKYYASALPLWAGLERNFVRASHPLTADALAAAKAALTLSVELCTAFKHLLARESEKRLLLAGNRLLVALIHRCLQCTARTLTNSFLSYSPVPARTWHDAHQIYRFAMQRHVHQTAVAGDSPDSTPERIYVQTLLLALANPYGFLPGQLAQVMQYIQDNAQWAKITDVAPVHRLAKSVAIVPVGHDFPPFSSNKGGNAEGGKLFLLTFDLAFQIQEQLRMLDAGGSVGASPVSDAYAKAQYIALLRRLLRQWAVPPARRFNRLSSRARVVMCAGLPAVWQYSRGQHVSVADAPTGLPVLSSCQLINHTPGGYALRQTDNNHAILRIGDLIVLRVEGRNALQVAMVRWFRNTLRGSGLEFGCELLTDAPQAAAVRAEDEPGASYVHAVLVPEEPENDTQAMLAMPTSTFEVEQAILLQREGVAATAVLTKFVDQGPGFDLFEFVTVA